MKWKLETSIQQSTTRRFTILRNYFYPRNPASWKSFALSRKMHFSRRNANKIQYPFYYDVSKALGVIFIFMGKRFHRLIF